MKLRCDLSCPADCRGPCKYHQPPEAPQDGEVREAVAIIRENHPSLGTDAAKGAYIKSVETLIRAASHPPTMQDIWVKEDAKKFAVEYWKSEPDIFGPGHKNMQDLAEKIVDKFLPKVMTEIEFTSLMAMRFGNLPLTKEMPQTWRTIYQFLAENGIIKKE